MGILCTYFCCTFLCMGNLCICFVCVGFSDGSADKESTCNAGDTRDVALILGSGRYSGEGNDSLFQCSCLENPMNGGAWRATVQSVIESWTRLGTQAQHIWEDAKSGLTDIIPFIDPSAVWGSGQWAVVTSWVPWGSPWGVAAALWLPGNLLLPECPLGSGVHRWSAGIADSEMLPY